MAAISKEVSKEVGKGIRREKLIPLFIRDIIRDNTTKEEHCTQSFITNKLSEEYGLSVDPRTVRRDLKLLLDEDLFIFGNAKDGYWFDVRGYYF